MARRPEPEPVELTLSQIDPTPAFRVRADKGEEDVAKYAEAMKDGDKFPPVKVYTGGRGHYLLGDGGTRYRAAEVAGLSKLLAVLFTCESEDDAEDQAYVCAGGANEDHGRRRTNEDRRAAVMAIIGRKKYAEASDRDIAKICKVHHPLVRLVRESLTADGTLTGKAASTERKYKADAHVRQGHTTDGKGNVVPRKTTEKQLAFTADEPEPVEEPAAASFIPLIPDDESEPAGRATITDAKGRLVPPRLAMVFERRSEFGRAAATIKAVVKPFLDALAVGEPAFVSLSKNGLETETDNLCGVITSAAPYVVCPSCDGTGQKLPAGASRPSCGICSGRGWVSHGGWQRLNSDQKDLASAYAKEAA